MCIRDRKKTGVSQDDLALFWEALINMWELDRSAARGLMSCCGLYIFSHDNELGRAAAHKLFGCITVKRKEEVVCLLYTSRCV